MDDLDQVRAERDALLRDRLLLAFLVVAIADHSYDEAWHRLEQHGYTYDWANRVLDATDQLPPDVDLPQ
jgi:hypothetical protein